MKPAADLVPQLATLAPSWPRKVRQPATTVKWMLWYLPLLLALCLQVLATAAHAQDDPPGRVGRLANLQGPVSWFDHEEGQWVEADRNRPLTSGDRVATGGNGRAELRVGSSVLRLAAYTELEVLRLDDDRMVWQLHSGSVAVRLRSRDAAQETEMVTGEIRLQPERAGHYRIDRVDDTTWAAAWRGSLRAAQAEDPVLVEAGQRLELWRESARWPGAGTGASAALTAPLRQRADRLADDEFAAWAQAEDRQDERNTANRYVSPEMTGAEELDRHGRWEQHPEYGAMWIPTVTVADWAPYRFGRWAWVQPWGWTWVDDARWGFAPFHYGRWVNWRGRWAWCPGSYVARPVFAPALVAWVGGPRLSVSVSIGLPPVAWVPLAPREVFVPHYRHSPVHVDRVNVHAAPAGPPPRNGHVPTWRQPVQPAGPMIYTNQGVPGAVTVVPRDVLLQRQPVARAVVDVQTAGSRAEGRPGGGGAWEAVAPPALERRPRPDLGREDKADRSRPGPGGPEARDPRSPRGGTAPAATPGTVIEPTVPARGPAVQPPVYAPVYPPAGAGGVPALPPQRQPPQPPQQTTPPLAPAVPTPAAPAGPSLPAGPRFQVPPTEPQQPQAGQRPAAPGSDNRPPRDQRGADRRKDEMPRWSDGPQRPVGPAAGSTTGGSSGAVPLPSTAPAAPATQPAAGPMPPPQAQPRPAPPSPATSVAPMTPVAPASPPSPRPPMAPAERPAPPGPPVALPAAAAPAAQTAPQAAPQAAPQTPPQAAAQPAKPPAAQPAPATPPAPARTEKPRPADRSDRPAAADRNEKTEAEEGRKRVPDNRNRPREQLN